MFGKWVLSLLAVMAAGHAFGATAALANHQNGLYRGASAGGGEVEFNVASNSISEFGVTDVLTSCGYLTVEQYGTPISLTGGHPFSYGDSSTVGLRYSGSFPASGQAQGIFSVRFGVYLGGCISDPVGWSASLDDPGREGQGKRPAAEARKKKCMKIKNKRKRRKCLKKPSGKR